METEIALLRSPAAEYERALGARGYKVSFAEPLQFSEANKERLAGELGRSDLGGLVLTSARAVDCVAAVWTPALAALWGARDVFVVGPATERRVRDALGLCAKGAGSGGAAALASKLDAAAAGQRLLWPRGARAAPLDTTAAHLEPLVVYEATEHDKLAERLSGLAGAAGLVLFSAAGCELVRARLLSGPAVARRLLELPHFAIGDSTAAKILELGLPLAGVAPEPTPAGVLIALDMHFGQDRTRT